MSAGELLRARFGARPEAEAWAGGRVNLIGEHTDYNRGLVLPLTLPLGVSVALAWREDRECRGHSGQLGDASGWVWDGPLPPAGSWWRHVAAAARAAAWAGAVPRGFELAIDSDLPVAAGLSSSAALAVALARGFLAVEGREASGLEIARLAQRGESEYVGVRTGLMDQMAASVGRSGHGLLIDFADDPPAWREVRVPDAAAVVVLDSREPRTLAGSAYNQRREECERAVAHLVKMGKRAGSLREFTLADVQMVLAVDQVAGRRARHTVTENARVLAFVEAIEAGDLTGAGQLLSESHASLRDDYQVSSAALDALVEAAWEAPGVFGSRLTGAGFGGCTVSLVDGRRVRGFVASALEGYRRRTGSEGRCPYPVF